MAIVCRHCYKTIRPRNGKWDDSIPEYLCPENEGFSSSHEPHPDDIEPALDSASTALLTLEGELRADWP